MVAGGGGSVAWLDTSHGRLMPPTWRGSFEAGGTVGRDFLGALCASGEEGRLEDSLDIGGGVCGLEASRLGLKVPNCSACWAPKGEISVERASIRALVEGSLVECFVGGGGEVNIEDGGVPRPGGGEDGGDMLIIIS